MDFVDDRVSFLTANTSMLKDFTPDITKVSNSVTGISRFMGKDRVPLTAEERSIYEILKIVSSYLPPDITNAIILGDTCGYEGSHSVMEACFIELYINKGTLEKPNLLRQGNLFSKIRPKHRYMLYTYIYPAILKQMNILNKLFKQSHGFLADSIGIHLYKRENKYAVHYYSGSDTI